MTRYRFQVLSSIVFAVSLFVGQSALGQQWQDGASGAIYYNGGRVGVGTATPANFLHVLISDGAVNVPFKMETSGADSITGISLKNDVRNWHVRVDRTDGDKFKIFDASGGYRMTIDTSGNVGIGTTSPTSTLDVVGNVTVTGSVVASGNLAAKYQDLAEWVPASEPLTPGTVVVLNRTRDNEVMKSIEPYDTAVAGVISAQPGVILGEPGPTDVQVATTGRVKVKVDATRHAIRVGDLLVTSSKPGVAITRSRWISPAQDPSSGNADR
jgi:hypothetical protein